MLVIHYIIVYFCLSRVYNGTEYTWNGWDEEYAVGLALSQNILAYQLLLYLGEGTSYT